MFILVHPRVTWSYYQIIPYIQDYSFTLFQKEAATPSWSQFQHCACT